MGFYVFHSRDPRGTLEGPLRDPWGTIQRTSNPPQKMWIKWNIFSQATRNASEQATWGVHIIQKNTTKSTKMTSVSNFGLGKSVTLKVKLVKMIWMHRPDWKVTASDGSWSFGMNEKNKVPGMQVLTRLLSAFPFFICIFSSNFVSARYLTCTNITLSSTFIRRLGYECARFCGHKI